MYTFIQGLAWSNYQVKAEAIAAAPLFQSHYKRIAMKNQINIIHGDGVKALEAMKENQSDVAIVDPPYGLERFKKGGSHINKYGTKDQQWNNIKPTSEYFKELFRISKNQIIWGSNNFELPTSEYFIIWQKGNALDFSFAMVEQAWTNIKKPAKLFKYLHSQSNDIRTHPTQKPVALYKWQLKNYAKPGDKIIDTHGGSMSHAIAAIDMGFSLDIYEIDDDYYSEAVKRIKHHVAQLDLSRPPVQINYL